MAELNEIQAHPEQLGSSVNTSSSTQNPAVSLFRESVRQKLPPSAKYQIMMEQMLANEQPAKGTKYQCYSLLFWLLILVATIGRITFKMNFI